MKMLLLLGLICYSLQSYSFESRILANCRSTDLSNHIFIIKQDNGIKAAVHGPDDFLIAYYDVQLIDNAKNSNSPNWFYIGSGEDIQNFQFGKTDPQSEFFNLHLKANLYNQNFTLDRNDVRCLLFDTNINE